MILELHPLLEKVVIVGIIWFMCWNMIGAYYSIVITRLKLKLEKDTESVYKSFEGRGATDGGIKPHINSVRRETEKNIKIAEAKRDTSFSISTIGLINRF